MRRATYQAFFSVRVPNGMPELVGEAAERAMQSPAAYIRQAVIERLQREGVPIGKPEANKGKEMKAA